MKDSITPADLRMLDEWRHGQISETDFDQLHQRLEESPDLRAELRAFAAVETRLQALAEPGLSIVEEEIPPVEIAAPKPLREQVWIPWSIAGLAASLVVWLSLNPVNRETIPPTASAGYTALLVDEAGAEFANQRGKGEVGFRAGNYELKKGTAHLRYANGADLVIQAPARFQIKDEMRTVLRSGKVRAIVPPPARGFTIETPQVNFEDVGTEFALNVNAGTGESGMQVLDGQVNLRSKGDSSLLQSVFGGEWIHYRDGLIENANALDLSGFPSPGNIGYLRWGNERDTILSDPGVIAWFPFIKEKNESVLTNAQRNGGVPDGRIAGARWVSGRWPGKEALLFDRESDFVQLEIPGEYEELSVAVWLKVDRYDQEMNAILNSNGAEPGDMHLQLTRHGLPRGGLIGVERPVYEWVGNPVPLAKWVHVVQVLSLPERKHSIFVNGELVTKTELEQQDTIAIRPGYCRLGNWLTAASYRHQEPREFRGRIDELTVWNRVLSEPEINDLIERGRPSLLWDRENPAMVEPLPKP
ncbi:LamG-like jellyroll fold domain-containing protein [Verrucomicrobiales bacterium BCK34]|nr:LamG-like jellyroll fold domain-containing protein [Verrucomicrobiales bacterium BCK34]